MNSHFQFFRNSQVTYYTYGKGEPLFLIHGYQADSRIWYKLIPLLKDKFELIVPDLPGHGQSPLINLVNTMDFFAEVVFSIAMSRGYKGVSIAGHSMGGYVAMAFAQNYPNLTDRLFLLNTHPFEDSFNKTLSRNRESELINNGKKDLLLKGFLDNSFFPSTKKDLSEEIRTATEIAMSQPEKGMLADLTGMMLRTNKEKLLKKSLIRMDFILGEDDSSVPLKDFVPSENKKIITHLLNNCAHMSILERPYEIANIILDE